MPSSSPSPVSEKTVTVLEVRPWLRLGVESWHLPAQDRTQLLVTAREMLARVAVLSGAAPGPDGARRPDIDDGRLAAAIIGAALREDASTRDALGAAGRVLFEPARSGTCTQRAADAMVATITRHGMEVVGAGDGGAFVRRADDWFELCPDGALTGAADAEWRAWEADHPQPRRDERDRAALDLLAAPDRWRNPRVGAFDVLRPDVATVEDDWDELVLASAGARLDTSLLGRLEGWLGGLRAWESQHAVALGRGGAPVHEDVMVVRVRRLPPPEGGARRTGELGAGAARRTGDSSTGADRHPLHEAHEKEPRAATPPGERMSARGPCPR